MLDPIAEEILTNEGCLAPITKGDLTRYLAVAFAGKELYSYDLYYGAIMQTLAFVWTELSAPWETEHVECYSERTPPIIDWYYRASSRSYINDPCVQELLAPGGPASCCIARCEVSITPELADLHGYGWEDLSRHYRWHDKVATDPGTLSAARVLSASKQWEKPYWTGAWGVKLYMLPWFERDEENELVATMRMIVDGRFSKEGKSRAVSCLRKDVPDVLMAVLLAATVTERPRTQVESYESTLVNSEYLLQMLKESGSAGSKSDWGVSHETRVLQIPSCMYLYGEESRAWFKECLDVSLAAEGERGELESVLHASLRLFRAARNAEPSGVAVGFAFAAIEAILTQEEEYGVTGKISRRCVALLQTDPKRRQDRVECVKSLYKVRCRVFHGRSLRSTERRRLDAIRLTAGVLRAVFAHRRHCQGGGHVATKEALISELDVCVKEGTSVAGVPDLSDLLPMS